MGSQYQLSIELDRTLTGGTFTNYDVVKGFIHLKNSTEISLESIQVKLEGISETVLVVERWNKQRTKKERRSLKASHKLLYDTSIVFPPKNVRDVAKGKKFTLIPGEYSYPFQFRIPLKNSCYKETVGNRYNAATSPPHIEEKLPPSLSGMGEFAAIRYFIKVTANRSGFFKVNLRSYDPFLFLPVDSPVAMTQQDSRQKYMRKEFILTNKIPEIVACYASPSLTQVTEYQKAPEVRRTTNATASSRRSDASNSYTGWFQKLFFGGEASYSATNTPAVQSSSSSPGKVIEKIVLKQKNVFRPTVTPINLAIYLEARFRYPGYLVPTKVPTFKLYIMTKEGHDFFQLPNGESSGLGALYLKSLKIMLTDKTSVAIEDARQEAIKTYELLNNQNINHKLDLFNAKRSGFTREIYEMEIPKEIYKNAVVPDEVAPSFRSCNIEKSHTLTLEASFSSMKTITKEDPLVKVALKMDVFIYSGLQVATDNYHPAPPNQLQSGSAGSSSADSVTLADINNSQVVSGPETDSTLPSYDDVINEGYEHPRRRQLI